MNFHSQNRLHCLERLLVAILLLGLISIGKLGVTSRPSDADLLRQVVGETSAEARNRAMHALIIRGYWEGRRPAERQALLQGAPPELSRFLRATSPGLLR